MNIIQRSHLSGYYSQTGMFAKSVRFFKGITALNSINNIFNYLISVKERETSHLSSHFLVQEKWGRSFSEKCFFASPLKLRFGQKCQLLKELLSSYN